MAGKKENKAWPQNQLPSSSYPGTLPLGPEGKNQQRRQQKLPHKASGKKTNERGSFGAGRVSQT